MENHISILKNSKTIAVVGCSSNPEKASNRIPKYMQGHGYKIIPVNPAADEILGEKCHKSLSEIKEKIDIVNIFRPSEECEAIVADAVKLKPKLIWLQLGIFNEKAGKIAEQHGIPIVMDKCIMVEHGRIQ